MSKPKPKPKKKPLPKQAEYASVVQPLSITVHLFTGRSFTWASDHPNFAAAREAIRKKAPAAKIIELMDVRKAVAKAVSSYGDVKVESDGVYYKGDIVHDTLTDRILKHMEAGLPCDALVRFMDNLHKSTSFSAHSRLFDFLESNKVPFTSDGCFLAYKKVRDDYTDYHTGTFDNSIGKIVKMPRHKVNDDPNETCSDGLHVCSRDYLPAYYGGQGKVVICKVSPEHVVAVPKDYNNAKMRCCQYDVVGELSDEDKAEIFDDKLVFDPGVAHKDVKWAKVTCTQERPCHKPDCPDCKEPQNDPQEPADSPEPSRSLLSRFLDKFYGKE